jgi:hypothetical protein
MISLVAFILFITAFFASIAFAIREEVDVDRTE